MLTSAMSSATSGLKVAQDRIATLSRNIANASTEGYNKKAQQQSTLNNGGARIDPVRRIVDEAIIRDLRRNKALTAFTETQLTALSHIDGLNGSPSEPLSLAAQLGELGNQLQEAATDPTNVTRMAAAIDQAETVANTLHTLNDTLQDLRTRTSVDLESAVEEAEDLIGKIVNLNNEVADTLNRNGDATDLQDQRDKLLSQLSEIIEVRTVPDDSGKYWIYSADWQLLGYSQAANLAIDTTTWSITADGQTVAINGGKTGGMRTLLTSAIPERLKQLDNIAYQLVQRFETVYGVGTGLFGFTPPAPAMPPAMQGEVVGKLRVNPNFVANPTLLRGPAATPAGDATWLNAARDVFLNDSIDFNAGPPTNPHAITTLQASGSFVTAASEMIAYHGNDIDSLKRDRESLGAHNSYLESVRTDVSGVSIDDEMAQMILFQNSYAAAARVMQATRDMFDDLIRIGG